MASNTAEATDGADDTKYKLNIVERLGGDSMFEFIVMTLVQFLKEDPKLDRYFGTFDSVSLHAHEKAFLTSCFTEHPDNDDSEAVSSISLRHYNLIDSGFCGKHFDMVMNHLVVSMDDAWVPEDVVRDAITIIRQFRNIFATEAELKKESLLRDKLVEAGEHGEIEVPIKDESSEPPTRGRRKNVPSRRKSTEDGSERKKKSSDPRVRRPSFEGLSGLRKAVGKTLSGEGLREMAAKLKEGSKGGNEKDTPSISQ